ncbi:MAG: NAD-binding protein [Thermodesulfobacteriota bacterium]
MSSLSVPDRLSRIYQKVIAFWPTWPLAGFLLLSGLSNIISGYRYEIPTEQAKDISEIARSWAILGSNTQIIMGSLLMLTGLGLLRRYRTAWSFAVLSLMITIGLNISLERWGVSLIFPGLVLIGLFVFQKNFTRQTVLSNYLISMTSIVAVLSYGSFGAYRLGKGFDPAISDLVSGLYFTIITLSTVGYGDITPTSMESRLFVISLVIVGLSIFATVIMSTIGPAISGELARILNPAVRHMKLKNHVILVGKGLIAQNTAQELADRNIPFTQVIDRDGEPFLEEHPVVHGDGNDPDVLKEAGIEKARMVIAAMEDDGKNAFISLVAKDLNEEIQVLAVASAASRMHLLKLARADMVFAPAAVGSRLLANLVEGNEISSQFQDLLAGNPENS